jgi:hypothetical protein
MRLSVTAEYLLWWMSRRPLPDNLVTGGPVNTGNPLTSSGPIGNPGTQTLFGGSQGAGAFSGGRLTVDYRFSNQSPLGLQASGFLLEERSHSFSVNSDPAGNPILTRPIFDVLDKRQSAVIVSFPGAFAGGVTVSSSTRLWGAESNLFAQAVEVPNRSMRWLVGFRYLDLQEHLGFLQALTILPNGGASLNNVPLMRGDNLVLGDSFHTRNQFYGGQIGTIVTLARGPLQLGLTGKLALGDIHELVDPEGSTLLFLPGSATPAASARGGVLALRTNSGAATSDRFAVIPEVAIKVGWRLNDRLNAFAGYSFLYCSDVVRPGDQVNPNINVSNAPSSLFFNRFPTPAQPIPVFRHTDYWAHGVNLGLEVQF